MSEIYPDQTTVKLKPGDKLLLCSDGLYNELEPTELTKIIVSSMSLEKAVTELIDAANNNGGLDNITAILIEKDN
jgi:protein phosphatase